jgi:transposase
LIQQWSRRILTLRELKKNGLQAIGKSRGGWNTKLHAVTVGDRDMVAFRLSGGNVSDAVEGRLLLETIGKQEYTVNLLMDRAYEDDRTRFRTGKLGFNPVVPPKRNRVRPWEYDMELYKRRNELERLFRWLNGFRGICTRSDKLDRMFRAFIYLACICISLRSVNTP